MAKFYTLVDIYGPLTNVKRTMSAVGLHLVTSNTISGWKCHNGTTFKIISCFSCSATFLLLLLSSPFSLLSSYSCYCSLPLTFPFQFLISVLPSPPSSSPSLLSLSLSLRHLNVDHSPFCLPLLLSLIRHFVTSLASFPSFVSLPLLPFLSSSSSSSVPPSPPSLSDVIWSQWIKCHFSAVIKVQFTAAHLCPSSLLQSFFSFFLPPLICLFSTTWTFTTSIYFTKTIYHIFCLSIFSFCESHCHIYNNLHFKPLMLIIVFKRFRSGVY